MTLLRVMTIVGTRPEIIRLSRIVPVLDQFFEHKLVHTGQNYDYELNQIFFDELQIRKPDIFLEAAGGSAAETIGLVIARIDPIIALHNPDAILILGDTNSSLAAIAAKRRKIPIFHMEAGNRSYDQRVPEEVNRRIVDQISDVNLTYSSIARDYLIREGMRADLIIKTGSPLHEVLNYYWPQIESSKILNQLGLKPKKYFLISAHREENVDSISRLEELIELLNYLVSEYELPVIVSVHPRTKNRIKSAKFEINPKINLMKPLGFFDYVRLQNGAFAVLSDSGTISEESSILNFPALNIRDTHERPEAMEEASVMMVGLKKERVKQAINILINQGRGEARTLKLVSDYTTTNVSEKVARIILSYTDYVNRVVWFK